MKPYYFIFKEHCLYSGYFQQVISDNKDSAKNIMGKIFGDCWTDSFTQEEFDALVRCGYYLNLKPLTSICLSQNNF